MADLLKITTPFINNNKNQVPVARQVADPSAPFNLQDVPTVVRPATEEEILKQNNGMIQKENSSNAMASLLKDPSSAVNFLKNIYVLQEIVQLLPIKNTAITQEIEQMFHSLLIKPEDIAAEMANQETSATTFKGEMFDYLRNLLSDNPSSEMQSAIANMLKSINNLAGRRDALNAVSNSLKFLSQSLEPSRNISQRLADLSVRFRQEDAPEKFVQLKAEAMDILKEMEGNLLFNSKMAKISSITLYNLSRFNDNPDFFQEAASTLFLLLNGEDRKQFVSLVRDFQYGVRNDIRRGGEDQEAEEAEKSKIMDVLTKILGKQAGDEEMSSATSEKIEKIITSLLSSPCHFTPLLHFVVPVEYNMLQSFAEIWINPNGEEDRSDDKAERGDCIHMLLVFDIEGMGKFEAELYTLGKKVELSLRCPPNYCRIFRNAVGRIERCINATSYRFEKIRVDPLERPNSLMDVFKSLPYKRTGVNVKV